MKILVILFILMFSAAPVMADIFDASIQCPISGKGCKK